jgi:uncharacterized membrane-anchored protein YhcB (DUF1043 family)
VDVALKFIDVLAWPTVALIAIIVLGPGGVLLRFTESLGSSISNFTRSLPELKSTAVTMRSDVETLVNKSKEMSAGFSEDFRKIEERIVALSTRLSEVMSDVKAVVEDIDRSKVVEEQVQIDRAVDIAASEEMPFRMETPSTQVEPMGFNVDQMYDQMRDSWTQIYDGLKAQLGEHEFDGRQIGAMARKLTDGRRARRLGPRDAELIQRLYSQFKRFARMQSYKDEWFTPDIFHSFQRGAEEALRALRSM